MPFLIGPAPIRRTLPYLKSGFLQLKDRVTIVEIHYNMYWKQDNTMFHMKYCDDKPFKDYGAPSVRQIEARYRARAALHTHRDYSHCYPGTPGLLKLRLGPRAIVRNDNHLGMREFYFWEVPRLQYQNPNVQFVRFLEMSPLPFLRVWLNETGMKKHVTDISLPDTTPVMKDVLFDCDNKDRFQILNQLVKTLGIPKETQERNRRIENQENLATFGINRRYSCICQVPDQVPCPGLVSLPMRMRGKYKKYKPEELEAWENDLERPYPTGPEMEKVLVSFPVKSGPPGISKIKGLETMYMRKPRSSPKEIHPCKDPEDIVADFQSDRLDKDSDLKLFRDHKR